MSRADQARRAQLAEERDRQAHERPNEPPTAFGPADSWEGICVGNRTNRHGWPSAKRDTEWRCGSCGRWVTAPTRTRTCRHVFLTTAMCVQCGWAEDWMAAR